MRRYHHLGIPTSVPRAGETHLAEFGVFVSGYETSPYGIEWMRWEPLSPLPDLVKTVPHVAFEVDDLAAEMEGREILIPPNSPSPGVTVAFIVDDGAPVELMKFERPEAALAPWRLMVTVTARFVAMLLVVAAILFLAAGTTDWPFAWAYLAVMLVASLLAVPLFVRRHPGLVEERRRGWRKEGAKGWDRFFVAAIAVVLPMVLWLVAGLDRRFGWSPQPVAGLAAIALAAAVVGAALSFWAMTSNPFFSSVVRIQRDRGHAVVTRGPYAAVRHPGYAGAIVANLAIPVVLGSRWALGVGALIVVLVVVRTVLEDRTLQRELDGYAAYAARVRWRLLPGVW